MSKTPRTDEHILHHGNGNWYPSAFVLASFARQIETELADKDKQLAEARAEIERLSSRDGNASHELVYDDGDHPVAREKLEHVDFGVCDNQYVLESHLLNNALDALKEVRAEIERLALEIENKQYTITCASEENQQLKESLAEARAEIERLKCCTNCGSRLWAATGEGNCKNCKDFNRWTSQSIAALAAERGEG